MNKSSVMWIVYTHICVIICGYRCREKLTAIHFAKTHAIDHTETKPFTYKLGIFIAILANFQPQTINLRKITNTLSTAYIC